MKKLYLSFVMLIPFISFAQSIERQVIGSMGSHQTTTGIAHTYTIGELMVTTSTSPSLVITQGFNQPEEVVVGIRNNDEKGFSIQYYPNPTESILNLEFESENSLSIQLELFSISGSHIALPIQKLEVNESATHQIDLRHLASGSYFLLLRDSENGLMKTLKIQKVQ